MTATTKTLLAQLAKYMGDDRAKGAALREHCRGATGRTLHRSMLRKYLTLRGQPTADFLLPILNWMKMHGLITSSKEGDTVFIFTPPLKPASKVLRPVKKTAAPVPKRGRNGVLSRV